jgi:acetyl esterase
MPLDRQIQALLHALEAEGIQAPSSITPTEARAQRRLSARLMRRGWPPEPVAAVRDLRVPGPVGPIALRAYFPTSRGRSPIVIYFHGGGWVTGDIDTHDAQARVLCNRTGSIVLSVDYRLAPEAPFPAAVADAYAATCWAAENAARDLGGDSETLSVAGESSGGNLAAAVALQARDQAGPAIRAQALVYPALDPTMAYPSIAEYADGYDISADDLRWFYRNYLPDPTTYSHPLASPLAATSLAELPPTAIAVAEFDPLRDEGVAFASRLAEAGVEVVLRDYPSLVHGFFAMDAAAEAAAAAVNSFWSTFRQLLGRQQPLRES